MLHGPLEPALAPLLIRFAGLADGERVLDVGCGTGSLTFTLPERECCGRNRGRFDPRFSRFRARPQHRPAHHFEHGDACALPFPDNSFDRAFSMLVLHFIPDAARAVAEMRRVVRPGGTVATAVWDNLWRAAAHTHDLGHRRRARSGS